MWIDFHVHTRYSYDSMMNPKKIVKISQKRGLSGVALIDHNIFSKVKLENDLKKAEGILVLFGTEIKTEWGDLVGLGITEEIKSRNFFECVDEIKEKNGISILVHPYRNHDMNHLNEMIKKVDWIEIWNSRSSYAQNMKAYQLKDKKPYTVGSDAHTYGEIGRCKLGLSYFGNIDELIKRVEEKKAKIDCKISPRRVHYYSSIIGTLRTGNYQEFIKGALKKIGGGNR